MVFNNNLLLGAAGAGGGGYTIDQSTRFNDGDSPYLNRTLGTPTSNSQFGYSFWVKLGEGYDGKYIISANGGGNNDNFYFSSNKINIQEGGVNRLVSNQVFRDYSSWYHFVVAYDLGNATATQKLRVYLNGSEITSWSTDTRSSLSSTSSRLNAAVSHDVGANVFNGVSSHINNWDGYITEFHFVDGAVLTPTDFGEYNADGVWVPIAYTNAAGYGTNGFYITGATASDLGEDFSGNNNDFTSSGLTTADQMLDTPTDNFCVLNPIDTATTGTLSDGNLVTSGNAKVTMRPSSGQWYYEKDGVGVSYDADTSGQFDPTLTAGTYNFGQSAWSDTGPTGSEKVLSTANLPDPTISLPSDYFQTVLDTGANIKTTAEALYTDQFEWLKDRANANNHQLIDSVRGTSAVIQSNSLAAETTYSAPSGNSVGWVWKANGTGSSNTDGTISSTVSANTTSGFSIVSYVGNSTSGATVGHGLGAVPKMMILKDRDVGENWCIYHEELGPTKFLYFTTDAAFTVSNRWNDTAPTSSVFTLGNETQVNATGRDYVVYCFAEVEGFSKIGSYTGNGSATDGPFVYTGFRPAFVMFKVSTNAPTGWAIIDNKRSNSFNPTDGLLQPDQNNAEGTSDKWDILSNGFKVRTTWSAVNGSGYTVTYMAFAETPFKTATAR